MKKATRNNIIVKTFKFFENKCNFFMNCLSFKYQSKDFRLHGNDNQLN